jgi:hypothetical protein
MVKVGWYPLIRGWSSILVHRDVCTHFVWIPIMGWMSIPHLIPCNLTMAHMGIAHLYVGNSLVYLHNKFNKSRSTKLILVILTYMTKHELQNYRNMTHSLVPHFGPAKTIFLPWILSPDPQTNIEYHHSMVPQRYDVIHIYILYLWWLWWWWFIYIYYNYILYIYISVFYSPIPAPWGVAHPGSPWTGEEPWGYDGRDEQEPTGRENHRWDDGKLGPR